MPSASSCSMVIRMYLPPSWFVLLPIHCRTRWDSAKRQLRRGTCSRPHDVRTGPGHESDIARASAQRGPLPDPDFPATTPSTTVDRGPERRRLRIESRCVTTHSLALPITLSGVRSRVQRPVWARSVLVITVSSSQPRAARSAATWRASRDVHLAAGLRGVTHSSAQRCSTSGLVALGSPSRAATLGCGSVVGRQASRGDAIPAAGRVRLEPWNSGLSPGSSPLGAFGPAAPGPWSPGRSGKPIW